MESIRQGADNNSKSFQANGLLQSHLQYNTARKIIGEIIARVRKPGGFHGRNVSGTVGRTRGENAPTSELSASDFGHCPAPKGRPSLAQANGLG